MMMVRSVWFAVLCLLCRASRADSLLSTTTTTTSFIVAHARHHPHRHHGRPTSVTASSLRASDAAFLPATTNSSLLSPTEVITDVLYPASEYRRRLQTGHEALGIPEGDSVSANDARLAFTYAEFPLASFHTLVDRAAACYHAERRRSSSNHDEHGRTQRRLSLVDLGSGCGRLVLYAALALNANRDDGGDGWDVHGLEISPLLHASAVQALARGVDARLFAASTDDDDAPSVRLHLGPAGDQREVLGTADVVFAYCTVWPTAGFSPTLGTMVLDSAWSRMLADRCPDGCVVVTTDRALDPDHGWRLLGEGGIDVPNPDVMGSTGYVQVLRP